MIKKGKGEREKLDKGLRGGLSMGLAHSGISPSYPYISTQRCTFPPSLSPNPLAIIHGHPLLQETFPLLHSVRKGSGLFSK